MGYHGALGHDPSKVAGSHIERSVVRRVLDLTRPYRGMLLGFLATIVGGAVLTLVPPLLLRSIIDDAIPAEDRGLLNVLALVIVLAAVGEAVLALAERWWSSRIGEGLIRPAGEAVDRKSVV